MDSHTESLIEEARSLGAHLGVHWTQINLEQFRGGLEVELEHSTSDLWPNMNGDVLALTGGRAWAHLKEIWDRYTRLDQLETESQSQG